ncbi:MAG: hypothetical protein ACK4HF_03845 [Paracoccaceae bacterium]
MTGKTTAGKRIAIQARLTEADHAIMVANMHSASFGLVSEFLSYLATSNLAVRINNVERAVGEIGDHTNKLLSALLANGVSQADVAMISAQLTEIQLALARGTSDR